MQNRCGWGIECRNVHICRRYIDETQAPQSPGGSSSSSGGDVIDALLSDLLPDLPDPASRLHLYWSYGGGRRW